MGLLCRLFGKSWQAYYQYKDKLGKQRLKEEMVIQFVKDVRRLDPGIGGEKLHYMYRERFGADYEYMVGRDKMEAIIAHLYPYLESRWQLRLLLPLDDNGLLHQRDNQLVRG